jgi:hypothetical protein
MLCNYTICRTVPSQSGRYSCLGFKMPNSHAERGVCNGKEEEEEYAHTLSSTTYKKPLRWGW